MPRKPKDREAYSRSFNRLLDTYNRVILCDVDNVSSQQLHLVRRSFRGMGELLMGKKTMQRKIISIRADSDGSTQMDRLLKDIMVTDRMLVGNLCMLFTDMDVPAVKEILLRHRVQAPARVGAVAPCDVVVPAGNTGMEPTATSFFQALNIATKISKGTVEILSDKKVLATGDKVDNSTATLLQKLKMSPFFYTLELRYVWDRGVLYHADDFKISDEAIEKQILEGLTNLTALSLGSGVPTELSMPHTIVRGFMNLLAVSVESGYVFPEFHGDTLHADVKEGRVLAAATSATTPAAIVTSNEEPSKTAVAAPEPVADEDSDDDLLGGLF